MKGTRLLSKMADSRTWAGNIQNKPGQESKKENERKKERKKEREKGVLEE